ncbi:hypothetical protein DCAR_0831308 [Daucus carota subsp. sativus]|uniref:Uncharacterized protein n=1 Tax=Daucus carota subsp. sativus TaxID=79200 RepID=A0A175YMW2_DAUCS|nr:hypothetical protein DCAR_0831308 [Daucus carota subsp. sativus]
MESGAPLAAVGAVEIIHESEVNFILF